MSTSSISEPSATLSAMPVELVELIVSFLDVLDIARLQLGSVQLRLTCTGLFARRLEALNRSVAIYSHENIVASLITSKVVVRIPDLIMRHTYSYEHEGDYGHLKVCSQPTTLALLYSIAHNVSLCEHFTTLTIDGVDLRPHAGMRRLSTFDGLYFPHLARLTIEETRVRRVADILTLIRVHASTLRVIMLLKITVCHTAAVVSEWFDLLTYVRDKLHLDTIDTAMWQPELYNLTKMLDYRHVFYNEAGNVVAWKDQSLEPRPAQEYCIDEVRLLARGRHAVQVGITAHISRMQRRHRLVLVKNVLRGLFVEWWMPRGNTHQFED
ncbi:hypothetical protein LTR75_009205 [Friedmanniomyces endolithicus]|nr:hypothetical protein LTR75_009205 [Friedmanniomyces endolithicus]